jgi:three-Cys-motif partner protein
MSTDTDDFFKGKRPWSKIKDRILNSYMSPYMAKVNQRGQPILVLDAFAGPGRFDDGQPGSPLIICQAAEKYAKGR